MSKRQPRLFDHGYLAYVRRKPCMACGSRVGVEAAHIRYGLTGMQRKPDDARALPLCAWDHRLGPKAQHKTGDEQAWWEALGFDALAEAAKLYAEYGGTGGKPKPPQKIKPRKPRYMRASIPGRRFNGQPIHAERSR